EMELVREFVLPKPWGPTPKVAMVYSWANARWRTWDRQLHDKTLHYHAAMRYLHWDFAMLPADMASKDALGRHRLVVAGGIDHVEPELVAQLSEHVKAGGTLIVGEGAMDSDLYGKAVKAEDLLGVKVKGRFEGSSDKLANVGLSDFKLLPGDIAARAGGNEVELRTGARTLWKDSRGRPMVTCHALGAGKVYYIAADLVGYPLAKLLATIREREGPPAALEITDAATGQLAPNILVSRRSYANHHALLLMNLDEFPKCLRIRVRDLDGRWHVSDPLEGRAFVASASDAVWDASHVSRDGIPYCITGENRGLLLFTRTPWAKTKLTSTTASDVKNLFDTELGQWQRSRGDTATPFSMDPSRASYVALAAVANATTADVVKDAKARWQGFPSTEPLVRTFAGIPFQIIRWDHNEMKGYVALHSAATPQHPESVRGVKVGAKASRLFFLHTCGEAADGETLGKYVVRYTDGRSADIPLVVGKTIARLNEQVERKNELATGLVTAIGSAWHVTEWKNPQPDAVIESLDLTASPTATGTIVLVAVTLEK
ncbi:MAG: hypothetical protein FJ278_02320, partial [Planctomycetes bacterium]|nr:hypothetical protein [Planctomycetota bacterium]